MRVIIISILALCFTACANKPVDLLGEGALMLQTASSEQMEISRVTVQQQNDSVEIDVKVRPKERSRWFTAGNVLIDVQEPDGNQFEIWLTEPSRRSHLDAGPKMQHAHFITTLPFVPKTGTAVRIAHAAD